MYAVGNIVSPQILINQEAPQYQTGIRAVLASWVINLSTDISLSCYYIFENRRRDRVLAVTPPVLIAAMSEEDEEFFDRTDKEDFLKFPLFSPRTSLWLPTFISRTSFSRGWEPQLETC
jgi:ACS family allantoate permease-like MFS transporter